MSLIELIIYISLVATFVVSGVTAAYTVFMSISHDREIAQTNLVDPIHQDKNHSQGFVAMLSATLISTALLLAAVGFSDRVADLYNQTQHTEHRFASKAHAYACLDQAMLRLAEDYFYSPGEAGVGDRIEDLNCSILSISSDPVINPVTKDIVVVGESGGIHTKISAKVALYPHTVKFLYNNFIIFL